MRFVALIAATAGLLHCDTRCVPCHARQVNSYGRTGMGRSIADVTNEPTPGREITHPLSGTTFRVATRSGKSVHEAFRDGKRAVYAPIWAIGSGNQGKSYVHRVQDSLFQSPVSWYTQRKSYDLSPGFETDRTPDFFRPITPECLFCHAAALQHRPGTQNRYVESSLRPESIGCDRCHGPIDEHLATPKKGTILNPARLDPERRDAVCEQCHLSGKARIPNTQRQFTDFRPGMSLEDVFSVYVRQAPTDPNGLKVVSHSEQMALSRCFLESRPKLWCATCHDPHAEPSDKVTWYREKCLDCHSGQKSATHEVRVGKDCAGCHMPRVAAYDGGHTAFHDHRIRVRAERASLNQPAGLRAWREPAVPLRNRNLGLAYISAGSKTGDEQQLLTGYELLGAQQSDGAVETARGLMLLRLNKAAEATHKFRRAVDDDPNDSTRRYNLAVALFSAGDRAGAMHQLETAIALEPMLEDAYILAAEIQPNRASEWKQRYLKLAPQRLFR